MPVTTHYDQGRAAFQAHRYDEAADAFEAALADDPGSTVLLRSLAFAQLAGGHPDRAEAPARRAAELDPGDAEAWFALGGALAGLHRHRDAIAPLDEVLRINANHVPARRQLVASLCQAAHQTVDGHADFAVGAFDRALKLDRNNPDVVGAYLTFLLDHFDVHRAVRLWRDLPEAMRAAPAVERVRRRMAEDPEADRLLRHLGAAPAPQTLAQAQAPTSAVVEHRTVPCPACRLPIMEWAAVCPHCNFRNRATGTFAAVQTGPDYDWKEIAYYIVAVLWTLPAVVGLVGTLGAGAATGPGAELQNVSTVLNVMHLGLGVGLLTKAGVIMLVVRYFSYFTLLSASMGTMFGFMTGRPLAGFLQLLTLGFTCFLLYLLNYMDD